jgi:hypothetical protein
MSKPVRKRQATPFSVPEPLPLSRVLNFTHRDNAATELAVLLLAVLDALEVATLLDELPDVAGDDADAVDDASGVDAPPPPHASNEKQKINSAEYERIFMMRSAPRLAE